MIPLWGLQGFADESGGSEGFHKCKTARELRSAGRYPVMARY